MKKIVLGVFSLSGAFFIIKSIQLNLRKTRLDGDGTGVYLLGFEVNDKVAFVEIDTYVFSFLFIGIILLTSGILINISKETFVSVIKWVTPLTVIIITGLQLAQFFVPKWFSISILGYCAVLYGVSRYIERKNKPHTYL